MKFYISNAEKMTLDHTGQLGINVVDPSANFMLMERLKQLVMLVLLTM